MRSILFILPLVSYNFFVIETFIMHSSKKTANFSLIPYHLVICELIEKNEIYFDYSRSKKSRFQMTVKLTDPKLNNNKNKIENNLSSPEFMQSNTCRFHKNLIHRFTFNCIRVLTAGRI